MERFEQILEDDEGNLYVAENEEDDEGNLYVAENEEDDEYDSNLVCDSKTKVIYYMVSDYCVGLPGNMVGYMAPYISENGKFCRFIDNQIVEIG